MVYVGFTVITKPLGRAYIIAGHVHISGGTTGSIEGDFPQYFDPPTGDTGNGPREPSSESHAEKEDPDGVPIMEIWDPEQGPEGDWVGG